METFRIHEDKENRIPKYTNWNGTINNPKNIKSAHRNFPIEKRRILALLTNFQNNAEKWNKRISPKPFTVNLKKTENHKSNVEISKENDNELLDKACLLLPHRKSNTTGSPLFSVTPKNDTDNCEMMSIEQSTKQIAKNDFTSNGKCDNYFIEPLYRDDIRLYLLRTENRHRPHPMYMSKQRELNDNMRCILVDWLVSISDEYNLVPETLHLAVSYIDRFLSKMSVVRSKLQLVGVAAMMIAAKYEEIYPPDVAEFAFLTNDTYTIKQILRMEQVMLRVLSFDLTTPTVQTFIDEFAVQGNISKNSVNMAMYISELCLVESVQYISYLPSEIAASSLALSRHTLEENIIWPKCLEDISGYKFSELFPIVKQQHEVFRNSPTKALQAVRIKFSRDSFNGISSMEPQKFNFED